jgi:hypothetical protein
MLFEKAGPPMREYKTSTKIANKRIDAGNHLRSKEVSSW